MSKYKLLTVSDHPLVNSGVANQMRYIIEGLLQTGKYTIRSLGGAMQHPDYRPQRIQDYGDDWIILPINGYGDENLLREVLDEERPDALVFMTDPRFYGYMANISDEVRNRNIPLIYNHVWDEEPIPAFNKSFYDSCDAIASISKLTHKIVSSLGHADCEYIPHAVNYDIFKPWTKQQIMEKRTNVFGPNANKFIYFYNSRNARRKMTSDVIRFFKETLNVVGQDKAFLLMHCDPFDKEGANLIEVGKMLGVNNNQLAFSNSRVPPEDMAAMYNIADATLCLSNNEGFGLSSLESLACGTPVISVVTGGLQDQNINEETGKVYGVRIYPKTKSLTGSQDIPYIFDCRCTDDDILSAYLQMYNMTYEERKSLGKEASEYVQKRFPLNGPEGMVAKWDRLIDRKIREFKENGYKDRIKVCKI